jgi:YgiT-type zinc finger domain-containing protein
MKCVFCGGNLAKKNVTFSYEEDDKYLLFENFPAEVCSKCGEKIYAPEVTEELLKFASEEIPPVRVKKVPVFDYAVKT